MKEIEVNGRKVVIKRMAYVDALDLEGLSKKEMAVKMFEKATDLTAEEIASLSIQDGMAVNAAINEENNLGPLQKPVVEPSAS